MGNTLERSVSQSGLGVFLSRLKGRLPSWLKLLFYIIISIMLISLFIFNIGGGGTFLGTYLFLLKYFTYIKYFYISLIIMKILFDSFELIILYLL